ncbi:MAG: ATP-binding protein [Lentisphaerota bacterium]
MRDNGRGSDTHRYLVSSPIDNERGMGLSAIQLRARMIGGDLKISSQPGKGTEITLFVPVNPMGAEGRKKMTQVFRKVLDEAKG